MSAKRDLERDNEPREGGLRLRSRTKVISQVNFHVLVYPQTCNKPANKDSIEYELCHKWEHYQCAEITKNAYKVLGNSTPNIMFFCTVCQPRLVLTLRFINEIEDRQKTIEAKLQKLEDKLKRISIGNNPS